MLLRRADSPEELSRLFQLRQTLFNWSSDEFDQIGFSVFAESSDIIDISLRICPLDRVPPRLRKPHVVWWSERVGDEGTSLLSRFTCTKRGQRRLGPFFATCLEMERQQGKRWGIGDCSQGLLPYYRHLGFVPYGQPFNDPIFGFKIPILLPYWDRQHLATCGSPILENARKAPVYHE